MSGCLPFFAILAGLGMSSIAVLGMSKPETLPGPSEGVVAMMLATLLGGGTGLAIVAVALPRCWNAL